MTWTLIAEYGVAAIFMVILWLLIEHYHPGFIQIPKTPLGEMLVRVWYILSTLVTMKLFFFGGAK